MCVTKGGWFGRAVADPINRLVIAEGTPAGSRGLPTGDGGIRIAWPRASSDAERQHFEVKRLPLAQILAARPLFGCHLPLLL